MKEKYVFSQLTTHEISTEGFFFPVVQMPLRKFDFSNLDFFKHQVVLKEKILNKQPYSAIKMRSSIYRNIFLNLGLLYLILSGILFWKGTFVSPLSFLQNSFKIHPIIPFFCFLSGLCCFYIGISMQSAREAIRKTYRKARRSLKYVYEKQRLRLGNSWIVEHFYEEGLEKLDQSRKRALQLAYKISRSADLDGERKEQLYNELLLELQEEMQQIVQDGETFESSALKAI